MMLRSYVTLRGMALMSLVLLGFQGLLAGVFYIERISFLDAAFVLVKIINEGQPIIMVGRYGAVLTQMWPWLGVKMGFSVDSLMLIYSMSFPFLYMSIGVLLFRLKQYSWIILIGLYFVLFNTHSYFWTNNEIHQAFVLFCLGVGTVDYWIDKNVSYLKLKVLLASLIVGLSILTHPLMLIVVAYYILYNWMARRNLMNITPYSILYLVIIIISIFKYFLSRSNWYDGQKISSLQNISLDEIFQGFATPEFSRFFVELPFIYPMALAMMVLWVSVAIKRRLGLLLALSLLFLVAHITMVSLVVDKFTRFYIESQWMLMTVFMGLPLVSCFNQMTNFYKNITGIVLSLSMVIWLITFSFTSKDYSERVVWLEDRIEWMHNKSINKMVIPALKEDDRALLQMTWGLPAESLLLSTRHGKSVSFILQENVSGLLETENFHDCFEEVSIEKLNLGYFKFNEGEKYFIYRK